MIEWPLSRGVNLGEDYPTAGQGMFQERDASIEPFTGDTPGGWENECFDLEGKIWVHTQHIHNTSCDSLTSHSIRQDHIPSFFHFTQFSDLGGTSLQNYRSSFLKNHKFYQQRREALFS